MSTPYDNELYSYTCINHRSYITRCRRMVRDNHHTIFRKHAAARAHRLVYHRLAFLARRFSTLRMRGTTTHLLWLCLRRVL